MNWQPIETAPRDGTRVLGYELNDPTDTCPYAVMRFRGEYGWVNAGWTGLEPTHWMPLPPPPEESK